jgi:competence protein ComEA
MEASTPATPVANSAPPEKPQAVPAWPRPAQAAMVFLLGVATTLLAVHGWRGMRWSSRPTDLERGVLPAYRIDLNRADRAELLQVPGVGPRMAQRIEDYRSQHGPFQSVGELRQVQGIGPTRLETFRPWISVLRTSTDSAAESDPAITQRPSLRDFGAAPAAADPGRKPLNKKDVHLTAPIDVNQATLTELQRLPGIGPKRAQMIIEERQKRPFASVDELRRVSGIGPKTLEKLRPCVTTGQDPLRIVTTGDVNNP